LHPSEKRLGRDRTNPGSLKLLNIGALSAYLNAHAFDLAADVLKLHLMARSLKNKLRTSDLPVKQEHERSASTRLGPFHGVSRRNRRNLAKDLAKNRQQKTP
jgi:hypothetical protein